MASSEHTHSLLCWLQSHTIVFILHLLLGAIPAEKHKSRPTHTHTQTHGKTCCC